MTMAVQQTTFTTVRQGDQMALGGALEVILPLRYAGARSVSIGYEIVGPARAPVLIVAGGISAGRHVISSDEFAESGWWECQKTALSAARILAIDWIGSDGALDCPIDPTDQALAIAAVLDALGIVRAAGFAGASYGAMVGLHFAVLFPHRCEQLLAISASERAHPFSSACRSLQRKAIALGERADDPAAGVALARALAMLTYRTADEYRQRFDAAPSVEGLSVRVSAEDYLDFQGARSAARTSAVAYRRLSESIDLHQMEASQLNLPCIFVAVESDWLVPMEDIRALADHVPQARFIVLPSLFGHDAFLKEQDQVSAILTEFIASLESAQ
ncbi:MAG: homoserine O-succinyltransferase [Sphingomicrobium sp.]|nr:homoserine O-succinyltransferase [Sphingomonadales bacterium]